MGWTLKLVPLGYNSGDTCKEKKYSETRLEELGVLYLSALNEINWVLENYPITSKKEAKLETTQVQDISDSSVQAPTGELSLDIPYSDSLNKGANPVITTAEEVTEEQQAAHEEALKEFEQRGQAVREEAERQEQVIKIEEEKLETTQVQDTSDSSVQALTGGYNFGAPFYTSDDVYVSSSSSSEEYEVGSEQAIRKETAREEAERNETAQREAKENAAREEAERKETERKEQAAREEAERKETERKEQAAREEREKAEREEEERKETERKAQLERENQERIKREEEERKEIAAREEREKAEREEEELKAEQQAKAERDAKFVFEALAGEAGYTGEIIQNNPEYNAITYYINSRQVTALNVNSFCARSSSTEIDIKLIALYFRQNSGRQITSQEVEQYLAIEKQKRTTPKKSTGGGRPSGGNGQGSGGQDKSKDDGETCILS
jgi:chemotaxis protein histidine kinase CheA